MNIKSSRSLIIALLGLGTLCALALPEAAQQNELQHDVSVTLKLVQVYVTDAEGKPVTDLGREDFVLYDNDVRRDITDFERHLLRSPQDASAPAPLPDDALLPGRARLNRKFFILLDIVGNVVTNVTTAGLQRVHTVRLRG